jgi:hypothetical protein
MAVCIQRIGSVGPGFFGAMGFKTQKISQLQFLYKQFSSSFKINKRTLDLCFKIVLISVPDLDPNKFLGLLPWIRIRNLITKDPDPSNKEQTLIST